MRYKIPTPAVESDFPVKAGKPARQALIVAGYHQLADLTQAFLRPLGPGVYRVYFCP